MATTTDLEKLVINYLTQDQYDDAREAGTLNANELYLTPDTGSTGGTVTSVATGGGLTGGPITSSGTISHDDTSSQSSVSNSGRTYIQSVTLDTYGHVTGLTSASESVTNTDENMKWTASTSSNTYYPLQSTSTATTSTANTLNGISFYQYYNTAGGYRRLDLGNATAWKSTGGAYGTIRLYGAAATYYGDLVPGVLGTTSGDGHISANRTWTLPDKTGTIALTSDIPTVPTKTSDLNNDSGFVTSSGVTSIATTSPISGGTITTTGTISHATSGVGTATTTAGFYKFKYDTYGHVTGVSSVTASDITGLVTIPTNTDESLKTVALTSGTIYYPILATGANAAANRQVDSTISGLKYVSSAGTTSAVGTATLYLGNGTASGTANNEQGVLRVYGTTAYYHDIKGYTGYPAGNRTIYLPRYTSTMYLTCTSTANAVGGATTAPVYVDDTGRIQAVTSIPYTLLSGTPTIPTVPSNIVNTITTTAGTHTTITSQKGDVSFNVPTKTSHLTNDSGFITTDSDENVKSTAIASAMTNYIVGSTTSTTTTGGLSKHDSAVLYTTANSDTGGYTQLRLGNGTATSSAGGKEGQIRLYGTNATYYITLRPGALTIPNKTITFPDATGTIALTSDLDGYLPLTGGDLSGNLRLNANSGVARWTTTRQNDASVMSLGVNASGIHGLYSDKGSRWMIQVPADGSLVTINEGINSNTYIAGMLYINGHYTYLPTENTSSFYYASKTYTEDNTEKTVQVGFGCGSNGGRHGVYSSSNGKWIIMHDGTDLYLDGTSTNNKITAWVNESGLSNNWRYRKFSDGTFDAWGTFSVTPTSSTASGNIYYSNSISITLPFSAAEDTSVYATGTVGSQYAWIVNTASAATTISFRIARGTTISTTTAVSVRLHIHGRY